MSAAEASAALAVEAALDAVITIDETGRVVQFNAAAEEMFGYRREEALGRPLAELIIPPDLRAQHLAGLLRAVSGEQPQIVGRPIKMPAVRGDGETFPVELTVTRSSDSPLLFTGFLRDLSRLRAVEAQRWGIQRLLSTAEELAQMGSWELDLRSGRLAWSDQMYRLLGLKPGSVAPAVGLALDVVHRDDRDRARGMLEMVAERAGECPTDTTTVEYRLLRRDLSVREVRARGRIERDEHGVPARWLGTVQDVTEQRLTERELRAHYAVGQALRDWESFEEGVVGLLRRLGTALEFAIGSLWTCDAQTERLTCRAFWNAPGVDAGEFEAITRTLAFRPGEDVPGQAWLSGQPLITPDVTTAQGFRRREAAARLGLRTGLAFPALGEDGPLAVLSYYTFDRRAPSERFVRTLEGIGRELGRFLTRRQAELGTRRLSVRELEVLRLGADGLSGPQIAERLVVSPGTIKTHFENIYEKLGVGDRAAAVAHALRVGLMD